MRRRDVLRLLSSSVLIEALAAQAQQSRIPTIGVLIGASAGASRANEAGFRQGLRQAGYVEGQNVHLAFRWADGRYDRLEEMAMGLVDLKVDVIAAFGPAPAQAAVAATRSVPVIFAMSADPIKLGFVTSLNRPGGNVTGLTFLGSELVGKQFEMLRELLPRAPIIGLLLNPSSPARDSHLRDVAEVTRLWGIKVVAQEASRELELDKAFSEFVRERAGGIVVPSDPFFYGRREQLATLAARHALPAIYADREYVADGGLMSYGMSLTDAYRQAGLLAARILMGDKPEDLPVQQAIKTELVVNLKTTKALSLEMPLSLLMRISEAIE